MRRLVHAIVPALVLCLPLLFSACAPRGNMIATLTQLPFAATPPTGTPGPTSTPRATRTITLTPPGYEATSAVLTSTSFSRLAALSATPFPTETAIPTPECIPGKYDEDVPAPDAPEQYIGKHYNQQDPPGGITWLSSGKISDGWTWAQVRVQGQEMYWIQKVGCRDAGGQPFWEIADALALSQLDAQANEVVVDLCFYKGKQTSNVIAYGAYDPSIPAAPVVGTVTGWPVRIISAWQMKERFIPINTRELTCVFQK